MALVSVVKKSTGELVVENSQIKILQRILYDNRKFFIKSGVGIWFLSF